MSTATILAARGLRKRFGRSDALRGADLELARGELVALRGPSGSGKSTLLHCLAAIVRPDAGEVWFAGERIDALPDRRLAVLRRRLFGFVFQYGQLVPELSALDNVALPLLLDGRSRRDAQRAAAAWLERLDASDVAQGRPGELSGGETQRVAIARALVTEPAVVLADEPTGALDSLAAETVMELLAGLGRERGVTLLVVTHEARVAAYAGREVAIRDGVCQAAGASVVGAPR